MNMIVSEAMDYLNGRESAEQAADARPGMVSTTTMFWATSTETTPSLKMLRRRVSEAEDSFRSDRV